NCRITQNFDSSHRLRWTKNVIDASIVDCRIACVASEIAKAAQDVAIRFAVVFNIIGIEVCLVGGFEFKVEITRDEDLGRSRSSLCPIDQAFSVSSSCGGVERVSVCAQKRDLRRV